VIPLGNDGDGVATAGGDGPLGAVVIGGGNSPVTGSNVVFPHRPQNFTPSAKRDWHLVHMTTTSVVEFTPLLLSRLPPRDGVN
jgi:hypothetical protein